MVPLYRVGQTDIFDDNSLLPHITVAFLFVFQQTLSSLLTSTSGITGLPFNGQVVQSSPEND